MIIFSKEFETMEEASRVAENLPEEYKRVDNLIKVEKFHQGSKEMYRVLVNRMETNTEHEQGGAHTSSQTKEEIRNIEISPSQLGGESHGTAPERVYAADQAEFVGRQEGGYFNTDSHHAGAANYAASHGEGAGSGSGSMPSDEPGAPDEVAPASADGENFGHAASGEAMENTGRGGAGFDVNSPGTQGDDSRSSYAGFSSEQTDGSQSGSLGNDPAGQNVGQYGTAPITEKGPDLNEELNPDAGPDSAENPLNEEGQKDITPRH